MCLSIRTLKSLTRYMYYIYDHRSAALVPNYQWKSLCLRLLRLFEIENSIICITVGGNITTFLPFDFTGFIVLFRIQPCTSEKSHESNQAQNTPADIRANF